MRLHKVILIGLLFLVILGFSPLTILVGIEPGAQGEGATTAEDISVEIVDSDYWIPSTAPRQGFVTGQEADIMLSGIDFNDAGMPLLFNHKGGIASNGTSLFLADRNNNRILI